MLALLKIARYALLALALAGCAHTTRSYGPDAPSAAAPAEGQAVVYVARGADLGLLDTLPVHVNEAFAGYLGRAQYVAVHVPPGPVAVKSRGEMSRATVLTFDAAADRAYYVRARTAGGALSRVRLDVVEAGAGADLVAHATPAPEAIER